MHQMHGIIHQMKTRKDNIFFPGRLHRAQARAALGDGGGLEGKETPSDARVCSKAAFSADGFLAGTVSPRR